MTFELISIGTIRGVLTLILLLAFLGMVAFVYSRRNRSLYDQAAHLPLEDSPLSDDEREVVARKGAQRS